MSFFEKWRRDRQARRNEQTETEFGLVVLAAIVNDALKTVQVSGYYRFRSEELDSIEGIFTRYPEGVPAAINQFFAGQHFGPWQLKFIEFLSFAMTNALAVLSAPLETLERSRESGDLPLSEEWKRSRLLADAEQLRNRVKPEWLTHVPRDVFAAAVDGAMEPILGCAEILFKECRSDMIESFLVPAFRRLQEARGTCGPFTNKCIERIEADPDTQRRLERRS